jgi:dihydroorotate dehydrogenase (fumarate)
MIDLTTSYMGLNLKNPLVCSASPLGQDLNTLCRIEEAGAAAVVLHSLFEEQINLEGERLDRVLESGAESFPEALSYFPDMADYNLGPDGYLEHIRRAKMILGVPLIASLNGATLGGWVRFAKQIEDAGADALELNVYFIPTDPTVTSAEVEDRYVEIVRAVRENVRLPLAVKIGPFFSAPAAFALRLSEAGADALVLFNRFYQPDFDVNLLEIRPNLRLSTPDELLLRLHWVAILFGRIKADLAVTGGVHSGQDVLKAMMAGARVAMTTSALLHYGVGRLAAFLDEMTFWMGENEYESVRQMQGSMSLRSVGDAAAFERGNYMKVLGSYTQRDRVSSPVRTGRGRTAP